MAVSEVTNTGTRDENLIAGDEIDTISALDRLKQGAVVIDVRTPGEYDARHIVQSFNIPLDQLSKHAKQVADSLRGPAILVCQTGVRARHARQILYSAGAYDVQVLAGGIKAWEEQGQPVIRGRGRWSLERQVRGVCGVLVLAGTLGGLLLWPPLTLLAALVGAGLTFAAVTDTCAMAMLLSKLPYNRAAARDVQSTLAQLACGVSRGH